MIWRSGICRGKECKNSSTNVTFYAFLSQCLVFRYFIKNSEFFRLAPNVGDQQLQYTSLLIQPNNQVLRRNLQHTLSLSAALVASHVLRINTGHSHRERPSPSHAPHRTTKVPATVVLFITFVLDDLYRHDSDDTATMQRVLIRLLQLLGNRVVSHVPSRPMKCNESQ